MESIVPVNPKALQLLEQNDFDLSGDTNQEANRKIKQIVVMAGINEIVEQDGLQKPKSMFVTTHTARRSTATNLYLNKVSLKIIADLGGWKDISMLKTYLRASGMDSANLASDLAFFN